MPSALGVDVTPEAGANETPGLSARIRPHGANETTGLSARIGMPIMLPLRRQTIGPLGANEAQSLASWRRSVGPLGVDEALEVCARIGMPGAPLHR